jgi:hypothetical protein
MAVHEPVTLVLKEKASQEQLMLVVMFGDILGIPLPRPYYALKLLPYVWRRLPGWKRSVLRQRDWTDWAFD